MYAGWLAIGPGNPLDDAPYVEIVNNARAYAYARNMGICWLQACEDCDAATMVTPGGNVFTSPGLDKAPWYDFNNPDTWGFLGVVGLDVQGDINSTRNVAVNNAVTTGGVLGPPYFGPRTLVLRCLAVAVDECSLTAGLEWLNFFAAQPSQPCLGDNLTFFDCCPCMCEDDTPTGPCWVDVYSELKDGPSKCEPDWWPYSYADLMTGPIAPPSGGDPGSTPLLDEPFDDLNAWVNKVGSPTVVPGGRRGTALKLTTGQQISYRVPVADESDTMTMGTAFKTTTLATSTTSPILFRSDNGITNHAALQWRPDGSLRIVRGSTVLAGPTAPGLITTNAWHYVEVQIKLGDAPNGAVTVRLNNEQVIHATGIDTRGGGTKLGFDTLMLTAASPVGSQTLYDDLYVKMGAGQVFMGDHTIPPETDWCVWPQRYKDLVTGPPSWSCCAHSCVLPYLRQYYNAMVTAGPTVLQHPSMHTQGAMAEFELTIVAADPAKHAMPYPGAAMVTTSATHIVDAVTPPSSLPPDPFSVPGLTAMRVLADVITRPAPAPELNPPTEWLRDEQTWPSGGGVLQRMQPLIEITSYDKQAEMVRVGLWAGDERIGGWLIPFIPAHTILLIDGSHRSVVANRGGDSRTLSGFVKDWGGRLPSWPDLPHGNYRITVDQEVGRAVRLLFRASTVSAT